MFDNQSEVPMLFRHQRGDHQKLHVPHVGTQPVFGLALSGLVIGRVPVPLHTAIRNGILPSRAYCIMAKLIRD